MSRLARIGILPILLAAASGVESSSIFTESEYLSAFDDQHPVVRESAEALFRAEAAARAAATLENPTLEALREDPSGAARQLDFVASWRIPDASRWSEMEARERDVDAARAHFEQAVTNHRLAMREAYATWAVADARRTLLESQAARVDALARREVLRAEMGEASRLEARRLKLAAGVLRSRVALAGSKADQARARASVWVPSIPMAAVPAVPPLSDAPHHRGTHSRIRAAEAELASAELGREAASRYLRSPAVSFGWQRQEIGAETVDGPIFGLSWSLPLFDRNQAVRESSDAAIDAAGARLEVVRREIRAEREAAERSYSKLRDTLAQTRDDLDESQRMLDGAEAAFRLGEASLTDLLETHRSVIEAELAALDLHQAALRASRELERLAGSGDSERSSTSVPPIGITTPKDIP